MYPQNFAYLSLILRVAWYQLVGALNFGRALNSARRRAKIKMVAAH
jgi:hypothetical protein